MVNSMGEKNIKKEAKKMKKSDKNSSASVAPLAQGGLAVQPQLIKKERKKK